MKKLESLKDVIDLPSFDHEENSFHPTTEFRKLMQKRVREILLVSSLYDSFLLAQDGRIDEQMISEFTDMNLYHVPGLIRSSNGKEALTMLEGDRRFNIILTTMNIGEMRVVEFAKKAKEKYPDTPIILLLFDDRELEALRRVEDTSVFDQIYIWQGNFKILLAIVKVVEDRINVEHDTWAMGVQSIILVEDNIRFYSSFLPMIYTEVMKQSQRLLDDGLNLAHKLLRMAARPKILHCTSYEEAIEFYNRYEKTVLGVITDVEYEMNGVKNSEAGTILAKVIRDRRPDLPIMIQSFQPRYEAVAHELNAHFLQKNSTTLLSDLREFMTDNFSFGDFLFRSPDGEVIDSANNLKSLEEKLKYIDERSLLFHAERDHFSGWLKARTEFSLAEKLKPSKVSDFSSPKKLREYIVKSLRSFRQDRVKGVVADFKPEYMDSGSGFVRIGGGSLGGKARGLAFINHLLDKYGARDRLPGIYIGVPPTVVLSTDVFDKFLETNDLVSFALNENDDVKILQRFLHSPFPVEHEDDIRKFLEIADYPLAVRSSSLLEDSQYHPFAGIYETFMIPNNEESLELRLESLLIAVKSVYASVFFSHAKNYIRSTMNRLEEEKMAVIVQKMVGSMYDDRFYPDFSGVARSYNFYPTAPMEAEDGVVSVGLGLGHMVMDGGDVLRFCPRYPKHLMQFATASDFLDYSQKEFFALNMNDHPIDHPSGGLELARFSLQTAELDGTLHRVGSVYSIQNDAVYDGLSRDGVRIVTFAPILKQSLFPLPTITDYLLRLGTTGMSGPVEIEFAVNLNVPRGTPKEFMVLQIRPLVLSQELEAIEVDDVPDNEIICQSSKILGLGSIEDIHDVVFINRQKYKRSTSSEVAQTVARMNSQLMSEERPYLLIGVGRWGSSDPWLGIPVTWDQICGARVIVETGFKDFRVTPSQGAHFFQNLTAALTGYFTVNPDKGDGTLDWEWLLKQKRVEEENAVCRLQLDQPIHVKMNGQKGKGIIIKPMEIDI